jgi:hypothetical protein
MNKYLSTCLLSLTCVLHAIPPDISNLSQCEQDVQNANANPPQVQVFDPYTSNYNGLLSDLQAAIPNLPHVYQEAAAKPLITYLQNLGKDQFLKIFSSNATDDQTATLQQIIPDAALAVLAYDNTVSQGVDAFEEVVSDLYESFLSDENRVNQQGGTPINPPTYGIIPPLVKFGNQDSGPYTWPADATSTILGMGCGVVSLPPAQLNGGLIAWAALGHETGGHDVTHADKGLLDELAQKVEAAVLQNSGSQDLADYWAKCIDEASADVCGYLNVGPSLGIALIGYFRALGDGKLRTVGSTDDPHPIDLLRGYLGAAVVKRLSFKDAADWSQTITTETQKDNGDLSFVDQNGNSQPFPVSFNVAVASADVVAQVIMQSKLDTLQGHSFQELEDWKDQDQTIVDQLVNILRSDGSLPSSLQGPGFYAAYVVAGSVQAGLEGGSDVSTIFSEMQSFLATMHSENPIWAKTATEQSVAILQRRWKGFESHDGKQIARHEVPQLQELALR